MRGPHEFQKGDLVYIAEEHGLHFRGEVRKVTAVSFGDICVGPIRSVTIIPDRCYRFLNVGEVIPQGTKVAVVQAGGYLHRWKTQKSYCVNKTEPPLILISLPKVDTELEKLKEELDKTQKHFEESRESIKKMRAQIRKMELKGPS